jgi:hypothetical protein
MARAQACSASISSSGMAVCCVVIIVSYFRFISAR